MRKFSIGDKVKLVSDLDGVTPMTVENYYIDTLEGTPLVSTMSTLDKEINHRVVCVWRTRSSELHREIFHEDTLVKA